PPTLFAENLIHQIPHPFLLLLHQTKLLNYLPQTFPLPLQVHKFNSYQLPKKIHPTYHIHLTTTLNQHLPFITHNPNYILDS
ncbi:ribose-5-phosphate isomerase A, partial [Staphylococcus epidermidis]|uniref:ribose-5-phosphate isomerase A n=1 Tax=Staphylococcus epidermidis TaxID=1282 RepID=UPI0016434573